MVLRKFCYNHDDGTIALQLLYIFLAQIPRLLLYELVSNRSKEMYYFVKSC